jgi:hypothetical protein
MSCLHVWDVQSPLVNQAKYFYKISQRLRLRGSFDPTSPRRETSLLNLLGDFGCLAFFGAAFAIVIYGIGIELF